VWISDVHLGNEACQYDKLLSFLKSFESDDSSKYNLTNLFLVGDIIDMTQFNHKVFWSKHRTVLKKLIRMADKGVNIIYVRGNHDYHLEHEFGLSEEDESNAADFNGIKIVYNYTY
jgi:UDP-2,3-diacylglucosamine pyrophosphatase LpxH